MTRLGLVSWVNQLYQIRKIKVRETLRNKMIFPETRKMLKKKLMKMLSLQPVNNEDENYETVNRSDGNGEH